MVECLTQDQRVADSCLTGVIVLWPTARHINSFLVLVQPRKTCPDMAEKLLTGYNQIKQNQLSMKFIMLVNVKMPTMKFIMLINV